MFTPWAVNPFPALSIVGFPDKGDPQILEQIIRAAFRRWAEAKCSVIGGHSIRNDDIQFGYASLASFIRNEFGEMSARARRCFVIDQSPRTGVISTALKKDRAAPASFAGSYRFDVGIERARLLKALQEFQENAGTASPIHAVTDVTGFVC